MNKENLQKQYLRWKELAVDDADLINVTAGNG